MGKVIPEDFTKFYIEKSPPIKTDNWQLVAQLDALNDAVVELSKITRTIKPASLKK